MFIEWLRACRQLRLAGPAALGEWRVRDPAAVAEAVAGFLSLDPRQGWRGNLLRGQGHRAALVLAGGDARRVWSRGELLAGGDLPASLCAVLTCDDWSGLLALAASHLLDADTRPDDRLLWLGDPADPWPYGAWLVGAAVVLPRGGNIAAIAAAEAALPCTAAATPPA
jgi:hypothetical protein